MEQVETKKKGRKKRLKKISQKNEQTDKNPFATYEEIGSSCSMLYSGIL